MADVPVTLGQAAIIFKGAYSGSTAYSPLDAVSNNGGAFLCSAACTGVEPGVTSGWGSYWVSMAKGIKNIAVSSPTTGTTNITINFSDGTTYTGSYSSSGVADNSLTTAKYQDQSVTGAKIKDGTITADKFAPGLNANEVYY